MQCRSRQRTLDERMVRTTMTVATQGTGPTWQIAAAGAHMPAAGLRKMIKMSHKGKLQ